MEEFTQNMGMMPSIRTQPAMFRLLYKGLTDIYTVVAGDASYVVCVEGKVPNGELAISKWAGGLIGLDQLDIPSYMSIMQEDHFTQCRPFIALMLCPYCSGSMEPRKRTFVCPDCKKTLW